MSKLTNVTIQEFLKDHEMNSETIILEEGKEKNDILAIAKAKGINLKNNKDLAGFKNVYAFADIPNKNKARLPKEKLLKSLPSIIGKPVDIDHNRRYVIGHYIDYKYMQKEDKVVTYGVFYKSNFGEEWERAKKLFKSKKLSTSYEIWCPKNKMRKLKDGTHELLSMELAGGAILFNEEPAFEDADVLQIAKSHIEEVADELIFASKYKEEEIIYADKGTMVATPPVAMRIKCSNCETEFEQMPSENLKCPKCLAILSNDGTMKYPPQIKDFNILCPSCKINNWLIVSNSDDKAHVKCLGCNKEYNMVFDMVGTNELIDRISFVYTGSARCPQCNYSNFISGTSQVKARQLKCSKCGLEFSHKIEAGKNYKKITKIEQIEEPQKSSNEGGQEMEFKIETSKFHAFVNNFEDLDKEINAIDELFKAEKAERLTTERRNALPDSMFAVVKRVKNKNTGKIRKIRMFPIHDESHVRNALARLGQDAPKATLKRLGVSIDKVRAKILRRARQLKMTDLLKRYKSSREGVKKAMADKQAKVTPEQKTDVKVSDQKITKELVSAKRQSGIRKAVKRVLEAKKALKTAKKESSDKEKLLKTGIKKVVDMLISTKKELSEKVEFYKANAQEIVSRRLELGNDYAEKLSDTDILNDDKFALAKAEKENTLLKAKVEKSDETVGDKGKDDEYYKTKRAEIDKHCFGNKIEKK